jgi:HK97 family phage prohead protease
MEKEARTLITKAYVEKQVEGQEGVLDVAVASSGIVDRYGEIVEPKSWDFTNFKDNPVFLWGHNVQEYKPPIGAIEKLWFENDKLMFKARFDLEDPFAKSIWGKYERGFLNAFSVGFMGHDWDIDKDGTLHYTKSELLEISAVAVPANPEALAKMKQEGMETKSWEEIKRVAELEEDKAKLVERNAHLEQKIDKLIKEVGELKKPLPTIIQQKNVTEEQLKDILRILNQATAIALKQIRQNNK